MARRSEAPGPCYSERLDEALRFAAEQFRFRVRKGSGVPYVTHLLQVCCTVGEYGGDEEQMLISTRGSVRSRCGGRIGSTAIRLHSIAPLKSW